MLTSLTDITHSPPTDSQLNQYTAQPRCSDSTDPAIVFRCALCVTYWWGRGHMQSLGRESMTARTTSPSLPDIYLTLESNRWRLQHFWKGMLEFYFTGCFVFPVEDLFWQGCYSEMLLFPPSSLLLYLSLSSLHLHPLFLSVALSLPYSLPSVW